MIKGPVIHAVRSLPAEFAADERTVVCELPGFLLASRPGKESLVWRKPFGRVRIQRCPGWELVSEVGCV